MSDDWDKGLTASRTAPLELRMQAQLFGISKEEILPISDAQMWRVFHELRACYELEQFRIWLAGSRVQPGNDDSDIDIVLSPRPGLSPDDATIERALWHCRNYGLYQANPACVIDPCFRTRGATLDLVPLQPLLILQTIKLFSPRLMRLVVSGRLQEYRRVGFFSIEYSRPAKDTDYYKKLPKRVFDGRLLAYLRPAIEITSDTVSIK